MDDYFLQESNEPYKRTFFYKWVLGRYLIVLLTFASIKLLEQGISNIPANT
ncbi:hypothetical protein JOD43_004072 [Pullulanibacillus pueri]|uniref:Uncharacterized protein n=1 Tax=Pullulanibacillus pueri TaxID=1437324 RepID=A0A8J2ZYH6_9BACL|nr:hypothetical protein [Pullulanibacillus pueri]MBM7683881.1 hypothetical protein [Pullulanibacillus pueri]GGH84650.1 hypothetical protein GCM10007096_28220 [Pullulanibacillus pueri]